MRNEEKTKDMVHGVALRCYPEETTLERCGDEFFTVTQSTVTVLQKLYGTERYKVDTVQFPGFHTGTHTAYGIVAQDRGRRLPR